MTERLEGYPYAEARFDQRARLVDDADRDGLREMLAGERITDLVVLAHGWNNDMDDARRLFARLAGSLRAQQRGPDADLVRGRRIGLLGVLWPSIRFADKDLIPGGAASFGEEEAQLQLAGQLDDVSDAFDVPERVEEARLLVPLLEDDVDSRREFLRLLREAVAEDAGDAEDASDILLDLDADKDEDVEALFDQLDDPTLDDPSMWLPPPTGEGGGAASMDDVGPVDTGGAAAGLGIRGKIRAAQRLLNFVTYYQMKARAGTVGEKGLAPLLRDVSSPGVRVHLVGHSFGARLVSAAAASPQGVPGLGSIVLLQAAFSHYGFAENWEADKDGLFRRVLTDGGLAGPMLVTHTRNDRAVGIAYALASRIANQVAAAVGGPDSRWGGLGANGAQLTPEAVQKRLLARDQPYDGLRPGAAYNLLADEFVAGHSAVDGREVAHALLAAVGAVPRDG